MSVEPSIAATVDRLDREDAEPVNWNDYRACSQVCRASIGEPCVSLSGKVVNGRPDDVRTELSHPHAARKLRTRGRRT